MRPRPCRFQLVLPFFLVTVGLFAPCTTAVGQEPVPAEPVPAEPVSVEPVPAEPAPEAQDQAADLGKLLLRTVEPLPWTDVASEDGFFRAKVPAKPIDAVLATDELYALELDFGAGADESAMCHVYRKGLDPASSLLRSSERVFELLQASYGELTLKTVYGVDAGGIGSVPYWGVDWLYRTAGKEGVAPVAGQAKHLIATKKGRAIYCRSTTLGYDDAFFNLFKVLVATVRYQEDSGPDPFYQELILITVGDQVLGVGQVSQSLSADGNVEHRESRSLLVPAEAGGLQAQDSFSLETGAIGGELLSKVGVEVVDGKIRSQLRLSRERGSAWKVGGTYLGHEIVKEIGEETRLSDLGKRRAFGRFLESAQPGDTFFTLGWEPALDPTLWSNTKLIYQGKDSQDPSLYRFGVNIGDAVSQARIDENLSLVELTAKMGVVVMTEQRVFVEGEPMPPSRD